jgi:hypothetical protein
MAFWCFVDMIEFGVSSTRVGWGAYEWLFEGVPDTHDHYA